MSVEIETLGRPEDVLDDGRMQYQAMTDFSEEEYQRLADDIRERGVLQPIITDETGTARLFYRGYDGATYRIGLASSSDFSSWTKNNNNPVLTPSSSGWDSGNINKLSVAAPDSDGVWHGIYAANSGGDAVKLGYATSTDLVTWDKKQDVNPVLTPSENYDLEGVRKPDLHFIDGRYHLLYGATASDGTTRAVSYAASDDLIGWDKDPANPVLEPDGTGFDATQTREISAVEGSNGWELYYGGNSGTEFAIGRADVT